MIDVIIFFSLYFFAWVGIPMMFIWIQDTWNIF